MQASVGARLANMPCQRSHPEPIRSAVRPSIVSSPDVLARATKIVSALAAGVLLAGCAASARPPGAVADLFPSSGSAVTGTVRFRQVADNDVRISGVVRGLPPTSDHGFHIHEKGDCTAADAASAGGHFNPLDGRHGRPDDAASHAGDLPNLHADATGTATFSVDMHQLSIGKGATDIIGRSLVVHADRDDQFSQPAGGSGARIACAVIRED